MGMTCVDSPWAARAESRTEKQSLITPLWLSQRNCPSESWKSLKSLPTLRRLVMQLLVPFATILTRFLQQPAAPYTQR